MEADNAMRILKESNYTYLKSNYKRGRMVAWIFLAAGVLALLVTTLWTWAFVLGIVSCAYGIKRFAGSLSFKAGIEGEEVVTDVLKDLDDSYYLINDVMLDGAGGNIDHILLGPKGVFVIETKNYSGEVRCYGDRWFKKGRRRRYEIPSISRQALRNAATLGGFIREGTKIRVFVKPICVFTNLQVYLDLRSPRVPVLKVDNIMTFIEGYSTWTALGNSQIEMISKYILENSKE